MTNLLKMSLGSVVGGTVLLGILSLGFVTGGMSVFQPATAFWPRQTVAYFVDNTAKPGTTSQYTLQSEPWEHYQTGHAHGSSSDAAIQAAEHGMVYSEGLARAAKEVAHFYGQTRRLAPSNMLAFFLDAGGAPYWGVRQSVLITTERGQGPVRELLSDIKTKRQLEHHVGVGYYCTQGIRVVVLLSAQKTFSLRAVPRRLPAKIRTVFSGRLEPGYSQPSVLVMGASGTIEQLEVRTKGEHFSFPFSKDTGHWTLEIIATGPAGPIPLAQLSLLVDKPLPRTSRHKWPVNEEAIRDPKAYLTQLINEARRKAGVGPLKRIHALDEVASYHSQDMRLHGFVGHYSPRTGMIEQRLRRIAYPRYTYGENVALNGSIADAHEGLMASLGHRNNLLSRAYTELGVGLRRNENGWYITQIFSAPGPVSGPSALTRSPLARN